jgi:hypothetical protein
MAERKSLKLQFPVQGWKQFLTSRKDMLAAYDSARVKAEGKKIKTSHGRAAESELRKWLGGFLPKRYGVTSGYIISPGFSDTDKLAHFDVIIYDVLNSPILWIDENPDKSNLGRELAIPAEYVMCVLEVKSSFSKYTVKKAIEHLSDLESLMGGLDEQDDSYKMYLPANFSCGLIFYEMRKGNEYSKGSMVEFLSGFKLRGFIGGLILRGEGHSKEDSGRIELIQSKTPIESTIDRTKESLLDECVLSDSIKITDELHIGAVLIWKEINFSQFGFSIIAALQGTDKTGLISSWYGLGKTL